MLRRDVQHAHLGGQDKPVVVRKIPAAGPQTVAVQHGAQRVAVGIYYGRGAIPGLHHRGIIVVKVPLFRLHAPVVGPWLRHGHHHGLGQRYAVHHKELQRVVQHGGVGAGGIHHRQDLVHVVLHHGRAHGLLAGKHAVHVAADGIYLAVVHYIAVGVRPLPAGVGVGGKA